MNVLSDISDDEGTLIDLAEHVKSLGEIYSFDNVSLNNASDPDAHFFDKNISSDYLSEECFVNKFGNTDNFSIIHFNCRSSLCIKTLLPFQIICMT